MGIINFFTYRSAHMRSLSLILLYLIFSKSSWAQADTLLLGDSSKVAIVTDTTKTKVQTKPNSWKKFWSAKYPSPKKALIYSLVLPGAGQAYNRKYWKLPLVAGLTGTFTYLIIDNSTTYSRLKSDYLGTFESKKPVYYPNLSTSSLKFYRDQYRYYLEQSYLWAFVSYAMIGIDAYVDAHLKSFDVSDDLSMSIKPKLQTSFGSAYAGVGLVVTWR